MPLFLDQIDNMSAYPRHFNTNSSEWIEELVEVITVMNFRKEERKGGATDYGWKNKHCNSLKNIIKPDNLIEVLTYILEEQYNLLETCSGNLELILLNENVDEYNASMMVKNL